MISVQQREEEAVFRSFANACRACGRLDFDLTSLKLLSPPAPDIAVRTSGGQELAFELTRVCDAGSSRRLSLKLEVETLIRGKIDERKLARDRSLWLAFDGEATQQRIGIRWTG